MAGGGRGGRAPAGAIHRTRSELRRADPARRSRERSAYIFGLWWLTLRIDIASLFESGF
jgi:hypothetical protein